MARKYNSRSRFWKRLSFISFFVVPLLCGTYYAIGGTYYAIKLYLLFKPNENFVEKTLTTNSLDERSSFPFEVGWVRIGQPSKSRVFTWPSPLLIGGQEPNQEPEPRLAAVEKFKEVQPVVSTAHPMSGRRYQRLVEILQLDIFDDHYDDAVDQLSSYAERQQNSKVVSEDCQVSTPVPCYMPKGFGREIVVKR
jgi:hypothetical protein